MILLDKQPSKFPNFLQGFVLSFCVFNPSLVQTPLEVPDEQGLLQVYHIQSEKKCAVEALWYETRGESTKGMQAVLEVINNRKNAKGFPSTICGVVEQPKQFSYRDGFKQGIRLDVKPYNALEKKAHTKVLSVVDQVFKGRYKPLVKEEVLWYTKTDVKTKWMKRMKVQAVIDSHKFMSLKGEKV